MCCASSWRRPVVFVSVPDRTDDQLQRGRTRFPGGFHRLPLSQTSSILLAPSLSPVQNLVVVEFVLVRGRPLPKSHNCSTPRAGATRRRPFNSCLWSTTTSAAPPLPAWPTSRRATPCSRLRWFTKPTSD